MVRRPRRRASIGTIPICVTILATGIGGAATPANAQPCPIPHYVYGSNWTAQADGSLVPAAGSRVIGVNNGQHAGFSPVLSYGVGGVAGWASVQFTQVLGPVPNVMPTVTVTENQIGCTNFINTACGCILPPIVPAGIYLVAPSNWTNGRVGAQFVYVDQPGGVGHLNDFSLDPLSPEVLAPVPTALAGDIIYHPDIPPYRFLGVTSAELGLLPAENVRDFSYGLDCPFPPAPFCPGFKGILYSVSRPSVGLAGTVIAAQAAGNGAAGDMFDLFVAGSPPIPGGAPGLLYDAPQRGLTAIPPATVATQSNVDGLDWLENHSDGAVFAFPVYYTVDAPAAARLSVVLGAAVNEATVLLKVSPVAAPVVYATSAMLGLAPTDVIDGLMVWDLGNILGVPGVLDAGDYVYISLAPGSPTAVALGTASIIRAYPPPAPVVVLGPAALGLLATDDVDALSTFDPGPICPPPGADCFTRGPVGSVGACGHFAYTRPSNGGHYSRGGPDCSNDQLQCIGDWDGDGCVAPADVAGFVASWFFSAQNPGNLDGDIDCNGQAVPADVAQFVTHWFSGLANAASEGCI